MSIGVDEDWTAAALIDSVYAGQKSGGVHGLVADADSAGLGSNTLVADIDVAIAGGEI